MDSSSSPVAVVFDMDECTGTWSYAGIFYQLLRYLRKERDPYARTIYIQHIFPYVVRPDFIQCLKLLQFYKQGGKVTDVVCYTANTGVGYPEFIRDCYEEAAGTPGLFTAVFVTHRGEGNDYGEKDLAQLRCLNPAYRPPFSRVIAFDDKPTAWSNRNASRRRVVSVSPYDGDPRLNIEKILNALSSRYQLGGNIMLERRLGDLTYYTRTPQHNSRRSLYDIITDFESISHLHPNRSDRVVRNVMIPSIRSFIHKLYPNINPTPLVKAGGRSKASTGVKKKQATSNKKKARSKKKTATSKTQLHNTPPSYKSKSRMNHPPSSGIRVHRSRGPFHQTVYF